MTIKKRRCKKGYNCGKSCISYKRACRIEFPEGVSVSLSESREIIMSSGKFEGAGNPPSSDDRPVLEKLGSPMQEEDFEELRDEYTIIREYQIKMAQERPADFDPFEDEISGENISFTITNTGFIGADADKGRMRELIDSGEWNGIVSVIDWWQFEDAPNDPRARIRLVQEAKNVWRDAVLPNIQDGTILKNLPIGGPQRARERAYRRQGFGFMSDTAQYGIVKNGKLLPLNIHKPAVDLYAVRMAHRRDKDGNVVDSVARIAQSPERTVEYENTIKERLGWKPNVQQLAEKFGDEVSVWNPF